MKSSPMPTTGAAAELMQAADEAFGVGPRTLEEVDLPLHSQIHLSYRKVMGGATESFQSNSQLSANKRKLPSSEPPKSPGAHVPSGSL